MKRRTIVARTGLFVFAILSAGCNFQGSFSFASEDKINSAFPISEAVSITKASVLELATDAQRKEIESQYDARLKLRALGCAKGYSPSWHTSVADIKNKLDNRACFTEADDEIARWLGFRRVGLLLAKPPLKPVPAKTPSLIAADGFIQTVRFASAAGIALIETQQSIEIADFETTKLLFREVKRSKAIGYPSPNGRLFTVGESDQLKIRDAESGSVIAEIPYVRAYEFHWLDEQTALYTSSESGKAFLIDFLSGNDIPLELIKRGVQRAVSVPDTRNQYVLFSHGTVTKIELNRSKVVPEVRLLAEKQASGIAWSSQSDVTADGTRFFGASRGLVFVDLTSLEIETIPFEPFVLQNGIATPKPDEIILTGFIQPPDGKGSPDFLYSISGNTVRPIEREKNSSRRYTYIRSIQKLAVINNNQISVVDKLAALEAVPLEKFASDVLMASNQRKLEAFERQQRLTATAVSSTATAPSPDARQDAATPYPDNPIARLARNAQIEAVGVYQGETGAMRAEAGRRTGNVLVHVRRSAKPLVLVLSSYEPVRWSLVMEPGAKLSAVLVSGYYQSQVVGAGSARVVMAGSRYAYKAGSQEHRALNQETFKWTGKDIDLFQGRYEGKSFSVGG